MNKSFVENNRDRASAIRRQNDARIDELRSLAYRLAVAIDDWHGGINGRLADIVLQIEQHEQLVQTANGVCNDLEMNGPANGAGK